MKDYYGILGVDKNASPDEIKKAYRKLSKQFHPDVNPDGEEKFKEIAEAYDTLSSPDKKQKYDNPMSSMFGTGGPGGMGFEDFLIHFLSVFFQFYYFSFQFFLSYFVLEASLVVLILFLTNFQRRNQDKSNI